MKKIKLKAKYTAFDYNHGELYLRLTFDIHDKEALKFIGNQIPVGEDVEIEIIS